MGRMISLEEHLARLNRIGIALTNERCLQILDQERGRHFHPDLVSAFMRRLQDVLIIREHYSSPK